MVIPSPPCEYCRYPNTYCPARGIFLLQRVPCCGTAVGWHTPMLGNLALIALCALFLLASLACTRTFTVVATAAPPPEPAGTVSRTATPKPAQVPASAPRPANTRRPAASPSPTGPPRPMSSPEPVDTSLPAEPPIPNPNAATNCYAGPHEHTASNCNAGPDEHAASDCYADPYEHAASNRDAPTDCYRDTRACRHSDADPQAQGGMPDSYAGAGHLCHRVGGRRLNDHDTGDSIRRNQRVLRYGGPESGRLGRGDFCRPGGTGSRLGYRRGRLGILDHPILPGRQTAGPSAGCGTARKTSLEIGRSTFSRAGR